MAGKKIFLYDEHIKLGATFCNFAGWDMPLHYGSQLAEHKEVRNHAGIFDVSHMGIIDIIGFDAKLFLRKMLANDVAKLMPGKALYSCLLNENGGIRDDLICYQLGDNFYRLIVNAGTTYSDLAWLEQYKANHQVEINLKNEMGILAIQGPNAISTLQSLFKFDLKPFEVTQLANCMIARTGYTGESGVEIVLDHLEIKTLWQQILALGIRPIGLGARDSLRLEAGYNLYAQDMDESVTPLESNIGWTVDLNEARDFIGKQAIFTQKAQGVTQQLVGIVLLEKGICRPAMPVWVNDKKGKVTSGGFSPTLACGIALARLPVSQAAFCRVEIRQKKIPAKIIKLPFVRQGKSNV